MASQSTTTTTNKKSSGAAARPGARGAATTNNSASTASSSASTTSATPETNETYGLVSVLYHALQGAETYTQYVNDARKSGDQELVDFFQECRDELNEQAVRARQLLATRLEDDIDDDEEEEDDDDEEEGDEEEDDEEA